MAIEIISACRVCGDRGLKKFFDLGQQPFANSLLDRSDQPEQRYSLSLSWCPSCNLVQLNETADPKELFSNYVWVTGTATTTQAYAERFYRGLIDRSGFNKDGYVLEIASNDGTFLQPFRRDGIRVLGLDPAANIAAMANQNGIPTECLFWGAKTAKQVVAQHGPAKIVFARNVLPHVANTRDFVAGLQLALADGGTLAIEVHYAKVILEELHYDSIYHEHLCYFSLKSLERLLNDHGLFVFDVTESPISGGSIVVYARKEPSEARPGLKQCREREAQAETNSFANWEQFAGRAVAHREHLLKLLHEAAKQGGLVGYGASARSSTMLNFCGITADLLPIIADKSPLKQQKYTAGSHILIASPEIVMASKPGTVFIMAWNFVDEIKRYLEQDFGFTGTYIVPLPQNPRLDRVGSGTIKAQ